VSRLHPAPHRLPRMGLCLHLNHGRSIRPLHQGLLGPHLPAATAGTLLRPCTGGIARERERFCVWAFPAHPLHACTHMALWYARDARRPLPTRASSACLGKAVALRVEPRTHVRKYTASGTPGSEWRGKQAGSGRATPPGRPGKHHTPSRGVDLEGRAAAPERRALSRVGRDSA